MSGSHLLRPATADDLDFQKQLYATTREDEMTAAGFPLEMRESFIGMQFKAQTNHYTQFHPQAEWSIIECDGVRAGRLILDRTADHLNVIDIALMPGFRGHGIGTILLKKILAEAAAKQLPVRLYAFTGERAIQLYHRLGFINLNVDEIHTELVWRPEPASPHS